jgi:methyl-accepting chemotaxis protein
MASEVLKGIRRDIQALGSRVDGTNERIDATNERLDAMSRRIVESDVRTSTAIADMAGTFRETAAARTASELRPRLERCEQDIAEIKRRVG